MPRQTGDGLSVNLRRHSFRFFVIVALMFAFVRDHMWLTLLMALPAAGLVVRLFVIQHDCGHNSFFATRASNDLCGRCLSLFTLTPYGLWKREHAQHHQQVVSGAGYRLGSGGQVARN